MSDITEITMSVGASVTTSTTSGGTYTPVGGLVDFKKNPKRGTSDASLLADTKMRKKPKGRGDNGTLELSVLYGKTEYARMKGYFEAATQVYWKLLLADGSVEGPWFGHISDFPLTVPKDDPLEGSITIDLSNEGAGTFTPGP